MGINTQNHVVCACRIIKINFISVRFIQPLPLFFMNNVLITHTYTFHSYIVRYVQFIWIIWCAFLCGRARRCFDMVSVSAHMFENISRMRCDTKYMEKLGIGCNLFPLMAMMDFNGMPFQQNWIKPSCLLNSNLKWVLIVVHCFAQIHCSVLFLCSRSHFLA